MSSPTLPLSLIVPVSVVVSGNQVPGPSFNQGLVIGQSSVLTSITRMRLYTSLAQMATDGFSTTSFEYNAASLYFGQTPSPIYLWVGVQDMTAIAAVTVGGSGGSGYVVGDILLVSGGTGGSVKVTTVSSGVVTGLDIIEGSQGTAYGLAINASTTGGTGTGAQVDITAIGETPLQAVNACRLFSPTWYALTMADYTESSVAQTTGTASSGSTALTVASGTGITVGNVVVGAGLALNTKVVSGSGTSWVIAPATTAPLSTTAITFYNAFSNTDKQAIAGYIEAASPPSVYFMNSSDAAILNNTPGNLFATLQGLGYRRTFPFYTTAFPHPNEMAAAVMGLAMGLNTGVAGSYFTLNAKSLAGVPPEPLTVSQAATIAGLPDRSQTGLNGNIYMDWNSGSYNFLINGTVCSGSFFDQTLFLDMLGSQIQINAVNLLVSVSSVPITPAGQAQMNNVVAQACQQLQAIGFIAPAGTWQGPTIGPITPGTSLPKGYYIYAPPVSSLTQGQRSARRLPPFNILIIEAESAQSVVVQVNVP